MTAKPHSRDRFFSGLIACFCFILGTALSAGTANAQSFGVELGNSLMPASGGMGGASISQPQDLLSAINANPATLRQYRGTNFTFGGSWLEPTYNISHDGGVLPNVGAYSAKSQTIGSALGNIGVTQDFTALGKPVTVGMALISTAGAGLDVAAVPESNGTSSTFQVLHLLPSVGVDLSDRLSVGAGFGLGISSLDGVFTGISKNTADIGVRGTFGANFQFSDTRSIGAYYHTEESFNYDDAVLLQLLGGGFSLPQDIALDLPAGIGVGIADSSLMNGRLLLAVDLTYRFYSDTALFGALYDDQLAVQIGTQYNTGRGVKLRAGYVWAENLLRDNPPVEAGGVVPPGGVNAIQYLQAQFATIAEHRITFGLSKENILPGMDLDIFGGGMFEQDQRFGQSAASIEAYWVGGGLTWGFGRGSGCNLAPNSWVASDCQSGCDTCYR